MIRRLALALLVLWGSPLLSAEVLSVELGQGQRVNLDLTIHEPAGPRRGVVLWLHGYLSSASTLRFAVARFVAEGYTCLTLDLPGHGRSEGRRFDIDDFADYGRSVRAWFDWARRAYPGERLALVAHSMGCAATLEALRQGLEPPDRVVFVTPLLRTSWFGLLSAVDAAGLSPVVGLWGSTYRARAHWFQALSRWLDGLEPPLVAASDRFVAFQGDRDTVVDFRWNRTQLRRLVPGIRWVELPGTDHWVLTDPDHRDRLFDALSAELGR